MAESHVFKILISCTILLKEKRVKFPKHGKFVLIGKGFLFEVLGFCSITNILIFKRFFKRFIKKSE